MTRNVIIFFILLYVAVFFSSFDDLAKSMSGEKKTDVRSLPVRATERERWRKTEMESFPWMEKLMPTLNFD